MWHAGGRPPEDSNACDARATRLCPLQLWAQKAAACRCLSAAVVLQRSTGHLLTRLRLFQRVCCHPEGYQPTMLVLSFKALTCKLKLLKEKRPYSVLVLAYPESTVHTCWSIFSVSLLFRQLWAEIDLTRPLALGEGWHSCCFCFQHPMAACTG